MLWCETLELIDNARVVQPTVAPLHASMSPSGSVALQRRQQRQQPAHDYASGAGYTSFESGAEERVEVARDTRSGDSSRMYKNDASLSRYELRPESRDSTNSFASSVLESRFDNMVHPSSAERVEMSSREQGPARPKHDKGSFFKKPWARSDTEDGGDSDVIAIGRDVIPLGEDEDPFFPSNVLSPREGNGHFMLLGSQFGEKESIRPREKKKSKLQKPAFVRPRTATPSEDDAVQDAEPPAESDLESTPFVDKKHAARPQLRSNATIKISREEEAQIEEKKAEQALEKARKKQLRTKQVHAATCFTLFPFDWHLSDVH